MFQYLHKPIAKAFSTACSHNKMLAGPSELWIMSASIDIMVLDSSIIIISHVVYGICGQSHVASCTTESVFLKYN